MSASIAAPADSRLVGAPSPSLLAAVGLAATSATAYAVAQSTILGNPGWTSLVRTLVVAAWLGAGAYTWGRRADSRLGPLLFAAGLLYALTMLDAFADPWLFTIGRVVLAGFVVFLTWVFVCYPRDRLGTRAETAFIAVVGFGSLAIWVALLAFVDRMPSGGAFADCRGSCPNNPFRVVALPQLASRALELAAVTATAVALAGAVALVAVKYRSPLRLRRRAIEPLLVSMATLLCCYVVQTIAREAAGHETSSILRGLTAMSALVIPFAFLAGPARLRLYAASSLGRLVAASPGVVTAEQIESFLRDALGDRSLRLFRWDAGRGRYVDVDGRATRPPTATADLSTTIVGDGRPLAIVAHDRMLDDSADLVRGLAATAMLLLENARLVDDLRSSRARIVATADAERLRLERNLHDGAQQRLLLIQIKLADLKRRAGQDDVLAELVDDVTHDAALAVDEIRTLAHGLYPPTLAERGVAEALRSVGNGAGLRVDVVDAGLGRCPPATEAAIYFTALEAIQNAAKHAGAGATVRVSLGRRGSGAEFIVEDDGAGFDSAAPASGSGIANMHDRVGAAGGDLSVVSSPGAGTAVRAAIPLGEEA